MGHFSDTPPSSGSLDLPSGKLPGPGGRTLLGSPGLGPGGGCLDLPSPSSGGAARPQPPPPFLLCPQMLSCPPHVVSVGHRLWEASVGRGRERIGSKKSSFFLKNF